MNLLRRIALWTLGIAAAATLVTYLGDSLYLRHKMSGVNSSAALGSVTYYPAAQQKNGTVEVFFESPQNETCVHALFPHYGYNPCWYSKRHTVRLMGRSAMDDRHTLAADLFAPDRALAKPAITAVISELCSKFP